LKRRSIRFFSFSDYVNGGELFTHLNKRQHFSEQDAKLYIAELALALGQLHKVESEQTFSSFPNE